MRNRERSPVSGNQVNQVSVPYFLSLQWQLQCEQHGFRAIVRLLQPAVGNVQARQPEPQSVVEAPRKQDAALEFQVIARPDDVAVDEPAGRKARRERPALTQREVATHVHVHEGDAVGSHGETRTG